MTAQLSHFVTLALPGSRTLPGLSVELAHSRFDRRRALELHRDVYRRKGLLPEDTHTLEVLPQACAPGSATFVAKENGAIVGTMIDGVNRESFTPSNRTTGRPFTTFV